MQQRPKKPIKAYEELFETLMDYTDYKSSDDVTTREDLFDFFEQVKDHSAKKGLNFVISKPLFNRVGEALDNIKFRGEHKTRKSKKISESPKIYRSFKVAKAHGMTAKTPDGKEIYKTKIIIYHDKKGKVINDKETKKMLAELRETNPALFKVVRK